MMEIVEAIKNDTIDIDEKSILVSKLLGNLPDRGLKTCNSIIENYYNDEIILNFVFNYLTLIHDIKEHKSMFVEILLSKSPENIDSCTECVKYLSTSTIDKIIDKIFSPKFRQNCAESILYEIAIYFPEKLIMYEKKIKDADVRRILVPAYSDERIASLIELFEKKPNKNTLQQIAFGRREISHKFLLKYKKTAPSKEVEFVDMLLNLSGISSTGSQKLFYLPSYLGCIDNPDKTQTICLGTKEKTQVPCCVVCNAKAINLITVDLKAIGYDVQSQEKPSFYWHTCPHEPSVIYTRFINGKPEGILTPMTEVDSSFMFEDTKSLVIAPHPNQKGTGDFTLPTHNNHQIGGYPNFVYLEKFPHCPLCTKQMKFVVSLDSGLSLFGNIPFSGIIYGYWCDNCSVSATTKQDLS